jgi:hypothetical protein
MFLLGCLCSEPELHQFGEEDWKAKILYQKHVDEADSFLETSKF